MITDKMLTVNGNWNDTKGLFIWGEYSNGLQASPIDLKIKLFSYHAPSFYGHQLLSGQQGNVSGVYLPIEIALDYWALPKPLQHIQMTWSQPLELFQQAAHLMKLALQNGSYMPDYSRWLTGSMGWKLNLVESQAATYQQIKLQWEQHGEQFGLISLDDWFSMAVKQWIARNPSLSQLFSQLASNFPLLMGTTALSIEKAKQLCADEDEFLQTIGWKEDNAPFRTLLQLAEPDEEDGSWRLFIVLQDQTNSEHYVRCTQDGFPIKGSFPAHWQEQLHSRIDKMYKKWLGIVPELAPADEPEVIRNVLNDQQAWEFLTAHSISLIEAGHPVLLPAWWEQIARNKPRLRAKIKSSVGSAKQSLVGLNQIVQFDWRLAIGNLDLSEAEFQELAMRKQRLVQVRGQWMLLDPAMLQKIQMSIKHVKQKKGLSFRDVLEQHLVGVAEQDDEGGTSFLSQETEDIGAPFRFEIELNEHLRSMLHQLEQPKALAAIAPPAGLKGTLRKYQLEGTSWMLYLRGLGLGGCLADDMGLGKTIQWIAYLLHLKESAQLQTPALLICPTSVIGNWQKELLRFAPDLRVHLHYGSSRAKNDAFPASVDNIDLVITSYTLSHLDEPELSSMQWSSLCLDEAQNIKNNYTKQAAAIRGLTADHRIALTGTPIENRLTELWSIFDFINPGYLSPLAEFRRKYVNIIERTGGTQQIQQVQKLVQPFLLRRLKKDPAIQLDLPEKNEMKTYVSLTVEQGSLYENVVQDVFKKIDTLSMMERRGLILAALTKLKQICNHPALFLKTNDTASELNELVRSNKLIRLLEMIQELRSEGDSCLIFTQYVEMGNLLQAYLTQQLDEPVQFLHGGVPKAKRDKLINQFQDTATPKDKQFNIFILSLKAGGIGLNLTAANHVFHFDRWWNPAVENQATDRAYRIGQTQDVQVHKFITLGTIEERIDEMIEKKQSLNDQIVSGSESWITEMSTADLRELFSLRREWMAN